MYPYEQLHSGALYDPSDPQLLTLQLSCQEQMYAFNATGPREGEKRRQLLKEMLAEAGEGCYIEPPFRANWGGRHLHLGSNVYINFNLTCVDDTHIFIGDNTMLGPNVVLAAGTHPVSPSLRRQGLQYNLPIHIGNNCWLGAGVIVLPGITIGDNSVIGAGSVVTKDIPANVVAVGNPCRVIRTIEP